MTAATEVQQLQWRDPEIGTLSFPGGTMMLRYGFGSGLAHRAGDAPGQFWAVGDRGPNIKVLDAIRLYALDSLQTLKDVSGAKVMPWLAAGPTLAKLQLVGDTVELLELMPIRRADGSPVTGLAHPASDQLLSEPLFDLDGKPIAPDLDGLDTEGIVALSDGGFWVGDEFGPSLVRLDASATVLQRLLPASSASPNGHAALPAIAAKRQLNRGFEALAVSADEKSLFLAFQSPLAHPDEAAHRQARHVRLWELDAQTGAVVAQYAYPLDPPETFRRDVAAGKFANDDIKVSELLWLPGDFLLVLERGSETTKIYQCSLEAERLGVEHLDVSTRPTLEEISASLAADSIPPLAKRLLFSSDDHPEVSRDIEGMIVLSSSELLVVSDNDFGVEGAETAFWRITLAEPITSGDPGRNAPERSS